jgi:hypothetical protein
MKPNYIVVNQRLDGHEKIHFAWATGDPICGAKINIAGKMYERHPESQRQAEFMVCKRCREIDKAR